MAHGSLEACGEKYEEEKKIEACQVGRKNGRKAGDIHVEIPEVDPRDEDELRTEASRSLESFTEGAQFINNIENPILDDVDSHEEREELHDIFREEYVEAFVAEYEEEEGLVSRY